MKRERSDQGNKAKQDKCPNCGSKKRVFERLSEQAVELGAAPEGFTAPYRLGQRVVGTPEAQAQQPMGAKVPVVNVVEDICYDCHTVYAPLVMTGTAEKAPAEAPLKKLHLPGQ